MDKLFYFHKEMNYLKKHGAEFTRKYPKIARRLGYQDGISEDPHIERLTESFAFLSAGIHQRLDEDLPRVLEAILQNVAPQFLYEYPSSCILSFCPDSIKSGLNSSLDVDPGTEVYSREGNNYIFRTVYPLKIIPGDIKKALLFYDSEFSVWKLTISISVWNKANIDVSSFRFYLNAPADISGVIYSMLCSESESINIGINSKSINDLTPAIQAVGFDTLHTMLPDNNNICHTHHLILDYFCFPKRFNFLDVNLGRSVSLKSDDTLDISVTFKTSVGGYEPDKIERLIAPDMFRLNCTPAINLFTKKTEPVRLINGKDEYLLNLDLYNKSLNFWSVKRITLHRQEDNTGNAKLLPPFFGLKHSLSKDRDDISWNIIKNRTGHDVTACDNIVLQLFDSEGNSPQIQTGDILSVDVICNNGNAPSLMNNGNPKGDFYSDIPVADLRIISLTRPQPVRPAMTLKKNNWRIISGFSLNYIMLSGKKGADAIREMLSVYNFHNSPEITEMIMWIKDIQINPVTARLPGIRPPSFARGINVMITLSADAYYHPEYFLFCSFLERFIGLHAPVNSFTQVVTMIQSRKQTRKVWPLRAGNLSWL